jgi:hypothetical protein
MRKHNQAISSFEMRYLGMAVNLGTLAAISAARIWFEEMAKALAFGSLKLPQWTVIEVAS